MRSSSGLIYGDDARVGAFVNDVLGIAPLEVPFVAIGAEINGKLVAGAMYWSHFEGQDIYISLAARKPYIRPEWVKAVLSYAFDDLRCPRISSEVAEGNAKAVRLNRKLGFEIEGIKQGTKRMICFGMTKETYHVRWT